MYRWYCKRYKDYTITQSQYTSVCREFNEEIMERILKDDFKFCLPYGMGMIAIKRNNKFNANPNRHQEIDFGRIKEVFVFHENEHTNGYFYKFLWRRNRTVFNYKDVYKFVAHKKHKRNLAKILKDPNRTIEYIDTNDI